MPELPQSALQILETAAESFSQKSLKGELLYRLTLPDVKRALATAQRQARADQVPAALYGPKHSAGERARRRLRQACGVVEQRPD